MNKKVMKNHLPPIPPLLGKENIGIWKNIVIQTFRFHGMLALTLGEDDLIDEDDSQNANKKAFGIILLISLLGLVAKDLENADWDFGAVEQNPKELYDLVLKLFQWRSEYEDASPGDCNAVHRFKNNLHLFDMDTLGDLIDRVRSLRREMKVVWVMIGSGSFSNTFRSGCVKEI